MGPVMTLNSDRIAYLLGRAILEKEAAQEAERRAVAERDAAIAELEALKHPQP
jgi:hypothetical protein